MVSRHIGVVIAAPRDAVVAFVRDPHDLPPHDVGLVEADLYRLKALLEG
jgi:hypothetical protein